jgi:hypothetical protein
MFTLKQLNRKYNDEIIAILGTGQTADGTSFLVLQTTTDGELGKLVRTNIQAEIARLSPLIDADSTLAELFALTDPEPLLADATDVARSEHAAARAEIAAVRAEEALARIEALQEGEDPDDEAENAIAIVVVVGDDEDELEVKLAFGAFSEVYGAGDINEYGTFILGADLTELDLVNDTLDAVAEWADPDDEGSDLYFASTNSTDTEDFDGIGTDRALEGTIEVTADQVFGIVSITV